MERLVSGKTKQVCLSSEMIEDLKEIFNYDGNGVFDLSTDLVEMDSNSPSKYNDPFKYLYMITNANKFLNPNLMLWSGQTLINTDISIEDIG